ncbi:MAG: class I SAM-dependent methyltransferase [bacterium]|nr:class I SAM-dependent methyltransferase [bacterium]
MPKSSFDIIVMQEVIEHIFDLHNMLKNTIDYLKKGGLILFGCPNNNSLLVNISGKNSRHYCPPNHKNHFNISSLSFLLEQHGCKLVRARTEHEESEKLIRYFTGDSFLLDKTESPDIRRSFIKKVYDYLKYQTFGRIKEMLCKKLYRPNRYKREQEIAKYVNGKMEGSYLVAFFQKI